MKLRSTILKLILGHSRCRLAVTLILSMSAGVRQDGFSRPTIPIRIVFQARRFRRQKTMIDMSVSRSASITSISDSHDITRSGCRLQQAVHLFLNLPPDAASSERFVRIDERQSSPIPASL